MCFVAHPAPGADAAFRHEGPMASDTVRAGSPMLVELGSEGMSLECVPGIHTECTPRVEAPDGGREYPMISRPRSRM